MALHTQSDDARPRAAAVAIRTAATVLGVGLLAGAALADRAWFQRHVLLPYTFHPSPSLPALVRVAAAVAGAALLALGPVLGRVLTRAGGRAVVALLAAILAAEAILRVVGLDGRTPRLELVVGAPHPRYGWAALPSRATTVRRGGRSFTYAVDATGARARAADAARDRTRPTLIVTGESIAMGYGLELDETFGALCARDLGLELADVAEVGYGPDQAHLRALDELGRLSRPAAVATVFVPAQLGRVLRDDRPRLVLAADGTLELRPPATGLLASSRLWQVFHDRLPYAGDAALARALATTRAVFEATARAAEARGAKVLFVAVGLGAEAWIRRALFEEPRLPHVVVDLGAGETLADGHPNERGSRRIADAIVAALGGR